MSLTNQPANRRILIVDDNPAIHEDYKKILATAPVDTELEALGAAVFGEETSTSQTLDFELDSAYQGEEALEMVTKALEVGNPYAMAFVDMRMPPGWDGLQTIEHLWKVDPRLQIGICTAFSDYSWSEIVARAVHRDRLLILKKPFDNIEVCQLAISLTSKWDLERRAEAEIHSIVETAADGIVTVGPGGVIESCNEAATGLFRVKSKELIGREFASLLAPHGAEEWTTNVLKADESTPVSIQSLEVEALHADQTRSPLLLSVSEYRVADGRRFTAILRDLTDYKQLQAHLSQARRLESIGQLAAGVAHEINTPLQFSSQNLEFLETGLGGVRAVVEVLERNLSPEGPAKSWDDRWTECREVMSKNRWEWLCTEIPKAITDSLDGMDRVARIVHAMKELTHPGDANQPMTQTDLNDLVEKAITLTSNRWKMHAKLDRRLEPGGVAVLCSPQDLTRVIVNLLINASDAIEEKVRGLEKQGTITVSTSLDGEYGVLSVRDNGMGIPQEVQDRIFDPFYTTKEVGKGTGQGLTLSREIVVGRHRGELLVDSTPNEGTSFTIRLPVCGTPSQSETAEACVS